MFQSRNSVFFILFFLLFSVAFYAQTATAVEDSPVTCFGGNDGAATVTAVGGLVPYSYLWDNGEISQTATQLTEGGHTVNVTDANGIEFSATVTITSAPEIIASAVVDSNVTCFGLADGVVSVSVSGGTPPFTYNWDKSGSTGAFANDLVVGLHTITITDANNCEKTLFATITEPEELISEVISVTPVLCNGGNDGEALISVSGGTLPYTYVWDQSSSTTNAPNDLIAGVHTVTVTDSNNCQITQSVLIEEPILLTASGSEISPVSCFGGSDGVATVSVTGGTLPYSYVWDKSASNEATASDLSVGIHTITITDVNNCSTVVLVTINEPLIELSALVNKNNDAYCNGEATGSATVVASGGTAPYTYLWDTSLETTATATSLLAGANTVVVEDANGCITQVSISIGEPTVLTIVEDQTTDVLCNGDSNGTAVVIASGGIGPYSYSWDKSSSTTASATDLAAGVHSITVQDSNNCTAIVTLTISEPELFDAVIESFTNPQCFDDPILTGSVTIETTGGTPPFIYNIDGGPPISVASSPIIISNLIDGPHSIVISDSNNCNPITLNQDIIIPTEIVFDVATVLTQDISCLSSNDGAITLDNGGITVSGGIAPYQYNWTYPSGGSNSDKNLTNLSEEGTYVLVVTDSGGCISQPLTVDVFLKEPIVINATSVVNQNLLCFGDVNASITVTVSADPSTVFEILWFKNDVLIPGVTNSNTITDLGIGIYSVEVNDTNPGGMSCNVLEEIEITEPDILNAQIVSSTNPSCFNDPLQGTVTIDITGGTLPYSYSVDGGASISTSISPFTITNLTNGPHSILITDANNCTPIILNQDIVIPEEIIINAGTVVQENISCLGSNDGSITLDVGGLSVNGGTAPYNYSWTFPSGSSSISQNLSNLSQSGPYTLIVTDAEGCESNAFVVDLNLKEPLQITSSTITNENLLCYGDINASIAVQVSADPTTVYQIDWNKNGTSYATNVSSIIDLGAGVYEVVVYDTNPSANCSVTQEFEITEPDLLTANINSFSNPTCFDDPLQGTVTFDIIGGTLPYLYSVDGGAYISSTTSPVTVTNLTDGMHSIVITDINSCNPITLTQDISIPEEMSFDASTVVVESICNGAPNGSISLDVGGLSVIGGVAPYNYTWTFPSGASSISQNIDNLDESGTYTLEVTDSGGCVSSPFLVDVLLNSLNISNSTITNQNLQCFGDSNASIAIQIEADAMSSVQIDWLKNDVSIATNVSTINNLGAGIYKVILTDTSQSQPCIISQEFEIFEPEIFDAAISSYSDPLCFDSTEGGTVTIQMVGGTLPYFYSLDGGPQLSTTDNSVVFNNLTDGDHTFDITDSSNCIDFSLTQTITIPLEIEITNDPTLDISPVFCDGGGAITVEVTGGTGVNYNYFWVGPSYIRSGPDLSTISNLSNPGDYTLYVSDENGCLSATSTFFVPDYSAGIDATGSVNQGNCPAINSNASIELFINGTPFLPLFITWEQWVLTDPSDPNCTSNCYSWQAIPNTDGLQIIGNLGPGEYRATLVDNSSSSCNTEVLNFSIADTSLVIYDEDLSLPNCEDLLATYTFKLTHYNPVSFYLNGNPLTLGGPVLDYDNVTDKYAIKMNGSTVTTNHLITIVEQLPAGGTGCEVLQNITLEGYEDIMFRGNTTVDLNPCDITASYSIDPNEVTGGTPFIDGNGDPYYNYEWFGPNNFHAFGATIPVEEGSYTLTISDSQNCTSSTIDMSFVDIYEAIEVTENITDVSCDAESDGAISVNITGGVQPFSIVWEQEIQSSGGGNPSYSPIATDVLTISNLEEGRYRLTVTSNIFPCLNENPASKFQSTYTLNSQNSIEILEQPVLDNELCSGNSGALTLRATDSYGGVINFFYNGSFVASENQGNNTYLVYIANPVDMAILNVVNDFGCGQDIVIETGVGTPSFEYTSDGFELNGIVNLNEDVTFTNTSTDSFYRIEWDFGDGSPIDTSAEPVHQYAEFGVFTAILRGYNELECFEEYALQIEVGSGFAIQFPEIFTPNRDGVNDYFQGAMMGVTNFSLEIYDLWNNLIYTEEYSGGAIGSDWGWNGNLQNGEPYNGKVFKYVFRGIDSDGEDFVISNQALLLR